MTIEEFKNLQNLAGISLSPEQHERIFPQMKSIIGFLKNLENIHVKNEVEEKIIPMHIRSGVNSFPKPEKLLQNVKHAKIGNAISIKGFIEK